MGLARYVVDAVVLEGRSPRELARRHGISKSWVYRLVARYREGGYPALEPRSRRPHGCSHQISPELESAIVALRTELAAAGHNAGPATIVHHLGRRFSAVPSVATVWRILRRHGLITPQPHLRRMRCGVAGCPESGTPNCGLGHRSLVTPRSLVTSQPNPGVIFGVTNQGRLALPRRSTPRHDPGEGE